MAKKVRMEMGPVGKSFCKGTKSPKEKGGKFLRDAAKESTGGKPAPKTVEG